MSDYLVLMDEMKLIEAGDHLVALYNDQEAAYSADLITAFLISRLVKNEKCFYISGDMDTDRVLSKVNLVIGTASYLESGQLSVLSKEDSYAKDGQFDPEQMICLLQRLTKEAIEEGFNAFAVTGELSWLLAYEDGFDKIMHYEHMLNHQVFNKYPVSTVCRFNMDRFSKDMILHIIEVHPIIILGGKIYTNPFYIETIHPQDGDEKTSMPQVDSMINVILNYGAMNNSIGHRKEELLVLNASKKDELIKQIIMSLSSLTEAHEDFCPEHGNNVAKLSRLIAQEIGLSASEMDLVTYASMLHDIGKYKLPASLLNKATPLTEEERDLIERHADYSAEILAKSPELKELSVIIRFHHENYDGSGYPKGLKSTNIPLASRIIRVADSYDAITNDRPYHKGLSKNEALTEVLRHSGTLYDPNIVHILIGIIDRV